MSANEVIEILTDSDDDDLQCISEIRLRPNQGNNAQLIDLDLEGDDHDEDDLPAVDNDIQITGERVLPEEEREVFVREASPHHINIHVPGAGTLVFEGQRQVNNNAGASFGAANNNAHANHMRQRNAPAQPHRAREPHDHTNIGGNAVIAHIQALRRQRYLGMNGRNNQRRPYRHVPAIQIHRLNRMGGRYHNRNLFVDEDYDDYEEENDADYFPGMGMDFDPRDQLPIHRLLNMGMFGGFPNGNRDEIGQDIMAMLERRDNADFDARAKKNQQLTEIHQKKIQGASESLKSPYTSTIEEDEEYVCVLCGVVLGVGIPDGFKGDRSNSILVQLQEKYDVLAPYQASKLISDVDSDLSKRIFFAKCGHTYCGRCVKNISNFKTPPRTKKSKGGADENSIDNPRVFAPGKCVADDCGSGLKGKTKFQEAFL
ncbi:hypothetical protein WICPIJ_006558 [Wickerhamomyces pijperi]|uniref:Uncharacterized protein n=1 Tax=Wickerhamomyces pijperi TaxID=599730 RepID=A0A9P8Q3R1_WICPI|nr:hypothetical protein WICPIJ_006558 [Wickerhamomyces pijperi]